MTGTTHPGKSVLVIDDDFATRETMSLALAADGYRVATARNGVEALERLRSVERPEWIVLDLKMPVMDGCAFCQERKRNEEWAAIPLLVLSALSNADEQAARLGAVACLHKPVDPIEVLIALRKCCRGRAEVEAPASTG